MAKYLRVDAVEVVGGGEENSGGGSARLTESSNGRSSPCSNSPVGAASPSTEISADLPSFTLVDTVPVVRVQHLAAAPSFFQSAAFCYVLLTVALLVISGAGTLMKKLPLTPPILRSFWRLFILSVLLFPPFVYQIRQLSTQPDVRAKYFSFHSFALICVSALSSAIHFGTWIWSLDHTSLSHSLFFVCSSPILVTITMCIRRLPINRTEVLGVLVGLGGSVFMLLDTGGSAGGGGGVHTNAGPQPVTVNGDIMAFLGAVTIVIYLFSGQHLRRWMPLFLYTFPMNLISTIPLLIWSYATEDITLDVTSREPNAVFGFVSGSSIVVALMISIGPGLIGHTTINFVLEHISPLVVTMALTIEPVLGVIIGIIFQEETVPPIFTLLGGPLSVVGCILTVYGTHRREREISHHPIVNEDEDDPRVSIELSGFQRVQSADDDRVVFQSDDADCSTSISNSSFSSPPITTLAAPSARKARFTAAMAIAPPVTHTDDGEAQYDISERELLDMLSLQPDDEHDELAAHNMVNEYEQPNLVLSREVSLP